MTRTSFVSALALLATSTLVLGPSTSLRAGLSASLKASQEPLTWTAQQDHQNMKDQLGIKTLRPGPSGRAAAGEPGAANYDPEKANPYPNLPDPLTLKNGKKVTSARTWWNERRPEIAEDFEREVVGRVPEGLESCLDERTPVRGETLAREIHGDATKDKLLERSRWLGQSSKGAQRPLPVRVIR